MSFFMKRITDRQKNWTPIRHLSMSQGFANSVMFMNRMTDRQKNWTPIWQLAKAGCHTNPFLNQHSLLIISGNKKILNWVDISMFFCHFFKERQILGFTTGFPVKRVPTQSGFTFLLFWAHPYWKGRQKRKWHLLPWKMHLRQGCHLSFTSKYPDFSLTFSQIFRLFPDIFSFPYPLTDKKEIIFILYFNGANCITSSLGVTLKGKNLLSEGSKFFPLWVAPNEEGDELRLSHEKVHHFPSWTK